MNALADVPPFSLHDANWLIAIFTGLLVLGTAAQIWVYIVQAGLMRASLKVTEATAAITERSLRLSEKAAFQMESVALYPNNPVGNNSKFSGIFKNLGKTMAKNVRITIYFKNLPYSEHGTRHVLQPMIVAPNGPAVFEVALYALNNQLTGSHYATINSSMGELWFTVRIDFLDIFDGENWVEYDIRFSAKVLGFPDGPCFTARCGAK